MPRRSKKRHSVPIPNDAPRSRRSLWSSTNVMSAWRSTAAIRKLPCASIRADRRSPPIGLARASPLSRHARSHRIALEALTPNRAAAACRDAPASTAPITRLRKSLDRYMTMQAGLRSSPHLESRIRDPGNPPRIDQIGNRSSGLHWKTARRTLSAAIWYKGSFAKRASSTISGSPRRKPSMFNENLI